MKKLLLLMSVFFMALSFSACSDDDEPNPEPQPIPENTLVLDGVNKTVEYGITAKFHLDANRYDLKFFMPDGLFLRIMALGELHDGKIIDLTKPETEHEGWFWVVELKGNPNIFNTYGDPDLSSSYDFFSSGTLFIKRLADDAEGRPVFEVKIQNAKIKDNKNGDGKEHTVEFYWKGSLQLPT